MRHSCYCCLSKREQINSFRDKHWFWCIQQKVEREAQLASCTMSLHSQSPQAEYFEKPVDPTYSSQFFSYLLPSVTTRQWIRSHESVKSSDGTAEILRRSATNSVVSPYMHCSIQHNRVQLAASPVALSVPTKVLTVRDVTSNWRILSFPVPTTIEVLIKGHSIYTRIARFVYRSTNKSRY